MIGRKRKKDHNGPKERGYDPRIDGYGYSFNEFHNDVGGYMTRKHLEYVCWVSMTDMFTLTKGVDDVLKYIKDNVPDESGIVVAGVVWEIERLLEDAKAHLIPDSIDDNIDNINDMK